MSKIMKIIQTKIYTGVDYGDEKYIRLHQIVRGETSTTWRYYGDINRIDDKTAKRLELKYQELCQK